MNISICITTLNEGKSISTLLDSLFEQFQKPNQIIIVDSDSTDNTVEIIRHYQQKDSRIKLLIEKCSRSRGRNLAIEIANDGVIAMIDAGCVANRDWLNKITAPFIIGKVDVSAGFYSMTQNSNLQKAESIYLGTRPQNFNYNFLPSTRSIAFTKKIWEEVGGFPEKLNGAAEDTVFNYKLVKHGARISRVKDAIVEWGMPTTIFHFSSSIFHYAKGDAQSKIWIFPGKGLASHNIKALLILFRYIVGLTFLIISIKYLVLLPALVILFLLYLLWAFRKVYLEFRDWKVALWGPVLQLASDMAVISGFISGMTFRK